MKPSDYKLIENYLNDFSHASDLKHFPDDAIWQHVLIIPVCGEAPDFLNKVLQHQISQSVLVILLVNRPAEHANEIKWHNENADLIQHLLNNSENVLEVTDKHRLLHGYFGHDLLLIDHNDEPFPQQQGVGLARRIAADTALFLIHRHAINNPWIFSTDADVVLPDGYFEVLAKVPDKTTAMCFDFVHISDNDADDLIQQQYDFKLKYYRHGVGYIQAAYDYIPLGSTLAVEGSAYAKVRGFPKRSGGEDFYILNKLAKLGSIFQPKSPVIEIAVRYSDRVPFGTGPAITQIKQDQVTRGGGTQYYHPEIFHILKSWKRQLVDYYANPQLPKGDHNLNEHWQLEQVISKALPQCKTEQRWLQFVHEWLDAFKILKSVHFLRQEFASVNNDALTVLPRYAEVMGKSEERS